jgi:hypothetical protein
VKRGTQILLAIGVALCCVGAIVDCLVWSDGGTLAAFILVIGGGTCIVIAGETSK